MKEIRQKEIFSGIQPGWLWVFLTLIFILIILIVVSFSFGTMTMNPLEIIKTLLGRATPEQQLVLFTLRLPRLLVAVLAGACLAVAGAILQGIIRNPLASPDLLGITGGAAVAAVGFLSFSASGVFSLSIAWLPLAAIIGALVVGIFIYSWLWRFQLSPLRVIILGIGVTAGTNALTMLILLKSPSMQTTSEAFMWITGNIYGATWDKVTYLLFPALILIPIALLLSKQLDLLHMDMDVGISLGGKIKQIRILLLAVSVVMVGSVVAIAGGIGFIGLMAPHIAHRMVGSASSAVLPVAALVGANLLIVADLAGRTIYQPFDIPCGVFVSMIGSAFFIYLLYQFKQEGAV